MEDKKMPFAVFILKYIENIFEDNKSLGMTESETIQDLDLPCSACPLFKQCDRVHCEDTMKKYVESAE